MSLGMPLLFYYKACLIRCVPAVGRGVSHPLVCCQLWKGDEICPQPREPQKNRCIPYIYRSMPSDKIRKTKREQQGNRTIWDTTSFVPDLFYRIRVLETRDSYNTPSDELIFSTTGRAY